MSSDVSIGQRIRIIASLGALAIVAAVVLTLTRGGDGHTVTLTGIWDPSPRIHDGVSVFVVVGGSNKVDRVSVAAPFHQSYSAKSGDKVLIRLTLRGTDVTNILGCSVVIDGLEKFKTPNPYINSAIGSRECAGVVP